MTRGEASRGAAVRRAAVVTVVYLVGAAVVWIAASWARPLLALPPSFLRLLGRGLAAGLPVAVLLAWHYPRLGHHGIHPDRSEEPEESR